MPHYKLTYFHLYGKAETSRFLFHLAGVPYEDVRVEFGDEWLGRKNGTSWGFLPELEVDGKKLAQSKAIHLHLAKQFGFNGKDDWEASKILEYLVAWDDIIPKVVAAHNESDTTRKAELTRIAIEDGFKPFYRRLEHCLEENGTGFFVGKQMTVADINSFVHLTGFEEVVPLPGVLAEFPKLVEFVERIQKEPKVKEWIEMRPKTPYSTRSRKSIPS